jgi:hypothetical protein
MMNDELNAACLSFRIHHSSFIIFVLLSAPFSFNNRDGKANKHETMSDECGMVN